MRKPGLDMRTATDLARNVWLAAYYEGGAAVLKELRREFEARDADHPQEVR